MANEIDAAGKGFLTSTGQLKDKKALAAEDNKEPKKSEDTQETQQSEDQSVSSALKPVRSRFTEDVNSVINVVNQNDENLKKAGDNIKQQIEAAQDLKQAIKDGDSDKADKKRSEIEKLQKEREDIAKQIDTDNKRLDTERVKSLSVGNKQKEIVQVKRVQFEKSSSDQDLEKVKDVNHLIDSLKSDRDNIKSQRTELREVKKEIKSVVKDVRKELDGIEQKSLKTIEDAQGHSEKLASNIVQAGSQKALVSNIDESVVKQLLAA